MEAPPLGLLRATLIAFVAIIATNAITLVAAELPTQGWGLRGLHHLYQAGRHLAAGLVVAAIVWACGRAPALRGRRGYLVLGGASLVVGAFTLVEDLSGFAYTALPPAPQVALWGLVVIVAGGVVGAAIAGNELAHRRLRWLAVTGGVAGLLVNPMLLESGYPGAHLYLAAACITLIATALSTAPEPSWWPRLRAALPWAIAGLVALFSLQVPPSNTLLLQLLRQEGDVVSPYLARIGQLGGGGEVSFPPQWEPWFRDRRAAEPVPPTRAEQVPDDAIVILLTIDSLRADVLEDPENDARLSNLAALRDRSLYFTEARAPGSQTVYTLAELFMGTYYSQQYWSKHPDTRDLWPDDDRTVRFPQVLTDAGIPTVNYATTSWLVNAFGIVRGFSEDEFVEPAKTRYSLTRETFPRIFDRLQKHGEGPLFIYTHALDAHYTVSPDKRGEGKARYMNNLELVDASVGQLVAEVERLGLTDRTILIVSSDHGEAFGEHDTKHHRSTLYEELLRVPLMVVGPEVEIRRVDTPVSVMDIGPTVLDLLNQPTPGHFMGESLEPFMYGKNPKLTRPLVAEGRLKKSLVFPDQIKVIVDDRHNTTEVYNLGHDPKEEINLLDSGDTKASDRVSVLRMLFEIHTIKREGYEPPFRG
jgi:hypothetical protein